jgi:hypothetical protein
VYSPVDGSGLFLDEEAEVAEFPLRLAGELAAEEGSSVVVLSSRMTPRHRGVGPVERPMRISGPESLSS